MAYKPIEKEMRESLIDEETGNLLKICSNYPELYNRVSNRLYKEFGLIGAELSLVCTWSVIMETKGEACGEIKNNGND